MLALCWPISLLLALNVVAKSGSGVARLGLLFILAKHHHVLLRLKQFSVTCLSYWFFGVSGGLRFLILTGSEECGEEDSVMHER